MALHVIPRDETAEYVEFTYMMTPGTGDFEKVSSADASFQWSAGVVLDTPDKDSLQIYKQGCGKAGHTGFCDKCAIAFSHTDDDLDTAENYNLTRPSFCGVAEGTVQGGFVKEIRAFWAQPGWPNIQAQLQSSMCGQLYTLGHSRGGAVASVFAFCVNVEETGKFFFRTNDTIVDEDKQYVAGLGKSRLVTFGALAPAEQPLWNGRMGNCFEGVRLYIGQEPDSPTASVAFMLAYVELIKKVYGFQLMWKRKNALDLKELYDLKSTFQWQALSQRLFDIIDTENRYVNEFIRGTTGNALTEAAVNAFVELWGPTIWPFSYDPAPTLHRDLKHPLMMNVPLHHVHSKNPYNVWKTPGGKLKAIQAVTNTKGPACNPEASNWPKITSAQGHVGKRYWFSLNKLLHMGLPNHWPCCYSNAFVDERALKCAFRYGLAGVKHICRPVGF